MSGCRFSDDDGASLCSGCPIEFFRFFRKGDGNVVRRMKGRGFFDENIAIADEFRVDEIREL